MKGFVYVTALVRDKNEEEFLLDVLRFAKEIVQEKYGVEVFLNVIIDNELDKPYMIINDMEPIIIDKIPSISILVSMFLAVADSMLISVDSAGNGAQYENLGI